MLILYRVTSLEHARMKIRNEVDFQCSMGYWTTASDSFPSFPGNPADIQCKPSRCCNFSTSQTLSYISANLKTAEYPNYFLPSRRCHHETLTGSRFKAVQFFQLDPPVFRIMFWVYAYAVGRHNVRNLPDLSPPSLVECPGPTGTSTIPHYMLHSHAQVFPQFPKERRTGIDVVGLDVGGWDGPVIAQMSFRRTLSRTVSRGIVMMAFGLALDDKNLNCRTRSLFATATIWLGTSMYGCRWFRPKTSDCDANDPVFLPRKLPWMPFEKGICLHQSLEARG